MMDGMTDRGVASPLSNLRGTEPQLTQSATEYRPTPPEGGESGSLNSREQRGDSATFSNEGMALAEREAEQHRVTGDLEGPLADPGKESELREGRSYQETLRNMEALRRDALGPPGPTMDDIRVAVRAQRIVNEVRAEHVANVHSQDVSQTPSADEVRDARSAETPEAVAPTTNEPAAPAPAAPQVRANELAEAFRPPSPSDPDGTSSISFFA